MNQSQRAHNLKRSSRLIANVIGSLDLANDLCEKCGRTSFHHYSDRMIFDRIGKLPDKLKELAKRIEDDGF